MLVSNHVHTSLRVDFPSQCLDGTEGCDFSFVVQRNRCTQYLNPLSCLEYRAGGLAGAFLGCVYNEYYSHRQ